MVTKDADVSNLGDPSKHEYTAKPLSPATEYEIQVAAQSADGCGPFSGPIIFKTFGGEL